jgi:hypothetical protein
MEELAENGQVAVKFGVHAKGIGKRSRDLGR